MIEISETTNTTAPLTFDPDLDPSSQRLYVALIANQDLAQHSIFGTTRCQPSDRVWLHKCFLLYD